MASSTPKTRENFGRMCRLNVEVNRDAMYFIIPENKRGEIPANRTKDECDTTILYRFIRNQSGLSAPSNDWGNEPFVNDLELTDDAERIRLWRNKVYGHVTEACIVDDKYHDLVSEMKVVLARLDQTLGTDLVSQVEKVLTDLMDTTADAEYQTKLREEKELAEAEDFQERLIERYRKDVLQKDLSFFFKTEDVLKMFVEPEIYRSKDVDDYQTSNPEDEGENSIKIKSVQEIFKNGAKRNEKIFLLGEAGVGKSTFCQKLIDSWCQAQLENDYLDELKQELKQFDFLLYVQAEEISEVSSVYEMVKKQHCSLSDDVVLERLFKHGAQSCLVVIDGVDELPSLRRGHKRLPLTTEINGCTFIITSRHSGIVTLDGDLDPTYKVFEIRGLCPKGVEELARKSLEAFKGLSISTSSDTEHTVKQFLEQINTGTDLLKDFVSIPLLLVIMMNSLYVNKSKKSESKISKCVAMSGMVESLMAHSEPKLKSELESSGEMSLPNCLSKSEICRRYSSLIHFLSKLAFEDLICNEKESPLVFRKHYLAKESTLKSKLDCCLKLGLLTASKGGTQSKELHTTYRFTHRFVQEFWAAVFLNARKVEDGFKDFYQRVTFPVDVFQFGNVIVFLSGMNPDHSKKLLDYICSVIFYRQYAHENLYPVHGDVMSKEKMLKELMKKCNDELQSNLVGSSPFLIPDFIIVEGDTTDDKLKQFVTTGQEIKSLVYERNAFKYTTTPFDLLRSRSSSQFSVAAMSCLEKLGVVSPDDQADKYIDSISDCLPKLKALKSFSFSVTKTHNLSESKYRKFAGKLCSLPRLESLHVDQLNLPEVTDSILPNSLRSLSLEKVGLPQGFMSSLKEMGNLTKLYIKNMSLSNLFGACLPHTLTALSMNWVDGSAEDIEQMCRSLKSVPSLRSLELVFKPVGCPSFDGSRILDLSEANLCRLTLHGVDLNAAFKINPESLWEDINLSSAKMVDDSWSDFLYNLSVCRSSQMSVRLTSVNLSEKSWSSFRTKFNVTLDKEDLEPDTRSVTFSHRPDK